MNEQPLCPICDQPFDGSEVKQLCSACAVKPEQIAARLRSILDGVGRADKARKDGRPAYVGFLLEGIHDNAQELLDALHEQGSVPT